MKIESLEIGSIKISFDEYEQTVLAACESSMFRDATEIISESLSETIRIVDLTITSQTKLQRAAEKFNKENQTSLGLRDMQELLTKCGL